MHEARASSVFIGRIFYVISPFFVVFVFLWKPHRMDLYFILRQVLRFVFEVNLDCVFKESCSDKTGRNCNKPYRL